MNKIQHRKGMLRVSNYVVSAMFCVGPGYNFYVCPDREHHGKILAKTSEGGGSEFLQSETRPTAIRSTTRHWSKL